MTVRIPTPSKRERVTMIGALNLRSKKIYWKSTDRGNAQNFIQFLHQLQKVHSGKQLHLILDNSSVHRNRKMREFLLSHPEIHLHFLPTYSPEYNPVEKIWWWLKPLVYGFHALRGGIRELKRRVRRLIWHYNEGRLLKPLTFNLDAWIDIINIYAD